MVKSILRRALGALGLAGLFVGTPAAAREAQARPALWEVSDADTKIYLFGTIHLLPENYKWRTPKFDQALNNSQQLVVETIVDEANPTKLMTVLASTGFSNGLPPIIERVSPDKRKALEEAIAKSGLPMAAFNRMETWTAAFTIMGQQFKHLGLKGAEGVEAVLRGKFASDGKPIGELESNAEQIGYFDRLPEHAQRALLESALETPENSRKEFSGMLKAWAEGDLKAVARTFDHGLAASPELYSSLLQQRNENWSKWIAGRMAQPGSVMVAVGAGHLAGKSSVIGMLEKQGYRVRRLQ